MAAIPIKAISPTLAAIYDGYERGNDKPRGYLGASIIGNECLRALWYGFRWATEKKFDGRMMRLFATGHREEDRMVEDLRRAGINVWANNPATGRQWSFSEESLGNHFAGNCDGVVQGLPEAPKSPHVLECKTHSNKSFTDLKAKGVRASKPTHFAQMQIYMHWTIADFGSESGCHRAVYLAHNKDTDELYIERIEYEKSYAKSLVDKAGVIINSPTPPARLSDDPTWFACKFCDHRPTCHGDALPVVSCRTCAHSTPEMSGNAAWTCGKLKEEISESVQRNGCSMHRYIPVLLSNVAEAIDADDRDNTVRYRRKSDGKEFINGDGGYESNEIRHGIAILGDEFVEDIRKEFSDSRIVEVA